MNTHMFDLAAQKYAEIEHNLADVYLRQFVLSLPALILVIYGFVQTYLDAIGVLISISFVVVAHIPFNWCHWEKIRILILSSFFCAFLYHLLPGFNHLVLYTDMGISIRVKTTLWLYVDLALIVATFGLTFFVKDQRYKSFPVHHCAAQFIQILTPKYRSKVIVNCWVMAMTLYLVLFFYFDLGTFELKAPQEALVHWFLVSLLITTLSQEFFIRGELQYYLTSHLGLLGVVLASLIGGLFYYPISPTLALIMSVIGLCSGYAYYKTQLIVSSVVINISILLVHLIFLTYPTNFTS